MVSIWYRAQFGIGNTSQMKTGANIGSITKRAVDALKCQEGEREARLWDSEVKGFFIRAYPTGRKVYAVKYRHGTTQRIYTIGKHGDLTPDEAREEAKSIIADLRQGKDAALTKAQIKNALSIGDLCNIYFTTAPLTNPNKREQTWHDDKRRIENHILPQIGGLKVNSINRLDAAKAINAIKEGKIRQRFKSAKPRGVVNIQGGEGAARRTLATISAIFNWGIIHADVATNPFKHINLGNAKTRERFLSHQEANNLIEAINSLETQNRFQKATADAIRVLLLTGARKSEITGLRWGEVDFARKRLQLPPERSKSGGHNGDRFINLMPAALEILKRRNDANEKLGQDASIYVFPSDRTGEPIVNLSKPFKAVLEQAGIDELRIHDLRHSFASFAIADGASLYLVSKLLGHSNTRTTERYAHLSNDPLQDAVEKIGRRIMPKSEDNTGGGDVVKPRAFE